MKIAILTQPLGYNYGGIMQAWALQKTIQRMGYDVITIDRQFSKPTNLFLMIKWVYRFLMKSIGKRKAGVFIEKQLSMISINNRQFISENLDMSKPLYSTEDLKKYFEIHEFDAVVVGSDQTWRPEYSPCIENFYLDFLKTKNIKRVAYASSFGVDSWEYSKELTNICSKLLKLFDFVGVREDSGVDLCKKNLGVNSHHVLDPTLLLTSNDYLNLIGKDRLLESKLGIYTYILDKTKDKDLLISKISFELSEQSFNCQATYLLEDGYSTDECIMPDPKDWLAGFANAKYIITDSFHGVVFSIIFRKPFICIVNEGRGSARFKSLLKTLNLEHHMLNINDYNLEEAIKNLTNEMNYDDLGPLVSRSKKLLFQSLA